MSSAAAAGARAMLGGGDPFAAQRKNIGAAVLFGAHLPTMFFVLLVGLFTFCKHVAPESPWLVAIIGGTFIVVGSWPATPKNQQGRNKGDWIPLSMCIFCLGAGITMGRLNNAQMEPYVHTHFMNKYTEVLPDADPVTVSDAGTIHFAEGVAVDTGSSAGLHAWPNTYCAAPIMMVDDHGVADTTVGFWAVGMNCCRERGNFGCDDAGDTNVRSGIRVETHVIGEGTGHHVPDKYTAAVRMAAASYGLKVAKQPVFVSWQRDPEAVGVAAWRIAVISFVLMTLVSLCCCFGMQQAIITMGRMR